MSGSDPPAPTPGQLCRDFERGTCLRGDGCKFQHRTDRIRCKFCLRIGHTAEKCLKKLQPPICQLCKKMGHTAERCKLRSSHKDRAVTVAEQNAIVAGVMNISPRTQSPKTLAPKRGGARGRVADSPPAHPSGPPAGGTVVLPHVRFNKKTGSTSSGICRVPATWTSR